MKSFLKKIQIPVSLIVGIYVAYWLIANPQESYTMPVIIIWLPDVIGWNAFFVLVGALASLLSLGIFSSLTEDKDKQDS